MAQFTTRVELHSANYLDYEILHTAMASYGFSRLIRDEATGTLYHLPTAEYDIRGQFTADQVLVFAQAAANTTTRAYCVLVNEIVIRRWSNLPLA